MAVSDGFRALFGRRRVFGGSCGKPRKRRQEILGAAVQTPVEALEGRRLFSVSVSVTASPNDIVINSSTELSVSATADGTIQDQYTVIWGDGSAAQTYNFSDNCTPIHLYSTAGNYTIEADVTDQEGCVICTGCGFASLEVDPPPAPTITHSISGSSTGVEDANYTLNMSWSDSDGASVDWFINWGDGNATDAGAATSTTHAYTDSGDYTISATAQSIDGNFTDSQAVTVNPAVDALSATALTVGQIDLSWTNNASGSATNTQIDRSTDGSTWSALATLSASATSYSNTGLSEDTHYFYRVKANFPGSVSSSYTNTADTFTLLAAPTGMSATAVNFGEIDLSWTNHSSAASATQIQRALSTDSDFAPIGSVAVGTTSFADVNVLGGTSYVYRAVAVASDGATSNPSGTATATPPISPPLDLAAHYSASGPILTWSPVQNAASYKVYRSSSPSGPWTLLTATAITATTYTDTSATAGTISYYQVTAIDSAAFPSVAQPIRSPDRIAVYKSGTNSWSLDQNGNQIWDPSTGDVSYTAFNPPAGSVAIAGKWNSSLNGKQFGLFDPGTGTFYLDSNGNGVWNASADTTAAFGTSGDQPIAGDWDGSGVYRVGVYRPSTQTFYLDVNGNGVFDSGTDTAVPVSPPSGGNYIPVAGHWSGLGPCQVGLFDTNTGTYYLYDLNGNSLAVNTFYYVSGGLPVVGDWNGDGADELGIYDPATGHIFIDSNGDYFFNNQDATYTFVSGGTAVSF